VGALLAVLVTLLLWLPSRSEKATIDFRAGFESGRWGGWSGIQYEFDRPRSESFKAVAAKARKGRYSGQFTARHGYSPFGWNESVEATWSRPQRAGEEYYYGFSTLFPEDWPGVTGWGIFLQFYTERFGIFLGAPPIVLDAVHDRIEVHLNTGLSPVAGGEQFQWEYSQTHVISESLNLGRWNDLIIRVRWEAGSTGIFEVWHRVEGDDDFRKALSLTEIPTLRRSVAHGTDAIGLIKLGLYRKSFCDVPVELNCTSFLGAQPPSVIYHDTFVRAHTFDTASQALSPT
jgi:hypothetical protein